MNLANIVTAQKALKYTYGLVCIAAGADKFFHFITQWQQYISPLVAAYLPNIHYFLYAVGIVEIIIGLLILSSHTKLGAYLASAWLLLIAANLVSMGHFYDIAVRDVALAVGAFALAQLTEALAR